MNREGSGSGPSPTRRRLVLVLLVATGLLVGDACLPDWPPPGLGDDTSGDDDTAADDDTSVGDDDTVGNPPDWVFLDGGTFEMGRDDSLPDQLPAHAVTVPDVEIWRTEVTVEQYLACVDDGGCTASTDEQENCNWGETGREDHPANSLTWSQAGEFCAWLGGRLPTEAEWEYAARGMGQAVDYPWGDTAASCDLAVMDDSDTGGTGCGKAGTDEACSRSPDGDTPQGLCDMAGNVFEWVEDAYHDSYVGAPTDGSAWVTGGDVTRVNRGGACGNDAEKISVTFRGYSDPETDVTGAGFRCARTPE